MRFYADRPGRFTRQAAADLLVVGWVIAAGGVSAAVGVGLWRVGTRVAVTAGQTTGAAGQLRTSADTVATVPFVGGDVATPLRSLAGTLTSVGAGLGGDSTTVHHAAVAYALATGILGVAVPVLAWCLTRGRWVRTVRSLRGVLTEDDLQALACAAAAGSSLRDLRRLPAGTLLAWTNGDPTARRAVAQLRLYTLGLHPPRPAAGP